MKWPGVNMPLITLWSKRGPWSFSSVYLVKGRIKCICFVWLSSCKNIHHGTCQSAVRWGLDQTVLEEGHVSRPPPNGMTTPQRVEQGNRCVFLIVACKAHISPILSDANDGRDVTFWGTERQKEWLLGFADCLERSFINRNSTQLLECSIRMIILEI